MTDHESTSGRSGRILSRRALWVTALVAVCIVVAAVMISMLLGTFHRKKPGSRMAGPRPPDLSGCTSIEIQYQPSILGYPVYSDEAEKRLLAPEEVRQIEILLRAVIEDPASIRALAQRIASGSYAGIQTGGGSTRTVGTIVGHCPDGLSVTLTVFGDRAIVTESKEMFSHKTALGTMTQIGSQVLSSELPRQVRLRVECARNLKYLYAELRGENDRATYPSAAAWCDAVIGRHSHGVGSAKEAWRRLECPAVGKASCNYALNRYCRPDSPADVVFLFEINAAWNQRGGSELFTFDNHNPRGGLVLLNDGTVRFIRTEEELKQLRWK